MLAKGLGGLADFALAGKEDEDVSGTIAPELIDGREDRIDRVGVFFEIVADCGAAADIDGIGPARDFDDPGIVEVGAEALRVDGGAGDDDLQIWALRAKRREIAAEEV